MSNDNLDLFADANLPPQVPPPAPPATLPEDAAPLDLFAERAYLAYAVSVVRSRALPQVEDGQKPVQRRILYAMHEMGLAAGAKHVKSARVVGDVLGKLHPHGDSSVYDAMVRISQDFSLRYPLADGQGNFGSRDGDGAAAMRYTEIRLTPIAELLLGEIERGTVDFKPNYDGSFKEPVLLPARLPFALLNGASGIAVGMATEMPPHNLTEVAQAAVHLIRHPEATVAELMAHLPGPDYPGGGQIISPPAAIRDAYQSGRGSLRLRARWRIEELARGQWRVIVNELPQGVSVAQVMAEIEALTNPQPKSGRKDLSQEQKNLKAMVLGVLDTARDESSDQETVRLLLEPKSSRLDPAAFMAVLLANTSLETSAPINLTMIGADGNPQQKNLRQILAEWIAFRFATVERRTRHRLGEVDRRIHILDGRMIAYLSIEKVIRVIRESDEPKQALIEGFGLSAIQADDILEIRLRQLARIEGIRIERELTELREERDGLNTLLESRGAMTRLIVREIEADAKRHGDPRRTLIEAVAPAASELAVNAPDEPVTVILSRAGWLRSRQGHGIAAETIAYKTGDAAFSVFETRSPWPLLLVDSTGRAYTIPVAAIPGGKGDGVPLTTLVDMPPGARLAHALSAAPTAKYLFAGSGGYGFVAKLSDLAGRNRAGKAFMTLAEGETILPPVPVPAAPEQLYALSTNGRLLLFDAAEMKELPKGRGVIVMSLDRGAALAAAAYCGGGQLTLPCRERGKIVQLKLAGEAYRKYLQHRARKGLQLPGKKMPAI
ncbi:DNA topoisomerase 4 subunit A [mine drainage metagenome]|uniref:DNA topoisomerase (ATP-hydrolyzing) n=1 Tax=mine drainage metagenome TaxID=410659 RepID=A0A1J5RDW7_9ZZZZ